MKNKKKEITRRELGIIIGVVTAIYICCTIMVIREARKIRKQNWDLVREYERIEKENSETTIKVEYIN